MSLPRPGSPGFTALLLAHVLDHPALKGWQIDPSLFSVMLLMLVVGKGGLLVDVEGKGLDKVVEVVQAMMESVFGLSTTHVALDSATSTDDLPWKLLHSPHPSQDAHSPQRTRHPSLPSTQASYTSTPKSLIRNSQYADTDRSDGRPWHGDGGPPHVPEVLLVTGMEDAPSPVLVKLCDYLTKRRIEVYMEYRDGVQDVHLRRWDFEPVVVWIRRERADVPWWVIDQFMCGITVSPSKLKLPPAPLDLGAIVPSEYIHTLALLLPYTHIHPPLFIHISNLMSAITGHPALRSTMTSRAARGLFNYVRAHRLLLGGFPLPEAFDEKLLQRHAGEDLLPENAKHGLGGGVGGVDSWAAQAGEEPDMRDLYEPGELDALPDAVDDDWYATPGNVQGVWKVCMKHRVRRREEREEVMWLMKGSASGGERKTGKKGVDGILDDIIRRV